MTQRLGSDKNSRLLWTGALLTIGLAVAFAIASLLTQQPASAPALTAAQEAAARDARITFFEHRAAADPLDFLSVNHLAAQYLQRARETGDVADYQRADFAASRSLQLVPSDNYADLVSLAAVRLVQHDYAAAERLADQATSLRPAKPAAIGVLADAQIGLGRYDDAEQTLAKMLEAESGLPELSRLANLAFLRGDRINAVVFWRQAIERSQGLPIENLAWARVQLGVTYFALGDLSQAASQHEKALDLYPGYPHALAGLAQVRAAERRWDEAIALNSAVIASLAQPSYVVALGDIYAASGQPEKADEQYALVQAIASLFRANGINTDLQIALFYLDHDLEVQRALAMATASYQAAPSVFAADALAWALYKNGRLEEAAGYASEATALGTLEPSFHFHAALISQALGDGKATANHLQRLSELNPRFSASQAGLATALLAEMETSR